MVLPRSSLLAAGLKLARKASTAALVAVESMFGLELIGSSGRTPDSEKISLLWETRLEALLSLPNSDLTPGGLGAGPAYENDVG